MKRNYFMGARRRFLMEVRRGLILLLAAAAVAAACLAPRSMAEGRIAGRAGNPPDSGSASGGRIQPEAEQLLMLANQARAAAGAGSLQWDPALAAAALEHCLRMAEAGPIAHQYGGEQELTQRAAAAGARFSYIEENVAAAASPAAIHALWMNSPGHRGNLLNPRVDRAGIAVVYARGRLYAVADYAHGTELLTDSEAEARIASLLTPYGLSIRADNRDARAYCGNDEHIHGPNRPGFLMRWTASSLTALPSELTGRIETGRYRAAEVGSCHPPASSSGFTAYQLAVLLF